MRGVVEETGEIKNDFRFSQLRLIFNKNIDFLTKNVKIYDENIRGENMLISYSVENYKSFKDKETLFMTPIKKYHSEKNIDNTIKTNNDKVPELLRTSCIYGANASGKTKFMQSIFSFWTFFASFRNLGNIITEYKPYAFDISKNKPITFEVEFLLNNDYYNYSFSFNSQKIITEMLKKNGILIYNIDTNENKYNFKNFKGEYKNTLLLMQNKGNVNLFIKELVNSGEDKILNDVYLFFLQKLHIRDLFQNGGDLQYTISIYNKGGKDKENIVNFIKKANPFIEDIANNFMFKYKNNEVLPFNEESEGTLSIFNMAGILINILKNGGILFIDELDRSLHPDLLIDIIKMFHNKEINIGNAQLIFTTHNDILLDEVFNENTNMYEKLFSRDQISFTQKNDDGSTILKNLSDFKDVKARDNVVKLYRQGYFGGRNIIKDFYWS